MEPDLAMDEAEHLDGDVATNLRTKFEGRRQHGHQILANLWCDGRRRQRPQRRVAARMNQ